MNSVQSQPSAPNSDENTPNRVIKQLEAALSEIIALRNKQATLENTLHLQHLDHTTSQRIGFLLGEIAHHLNHLEPEHDLKTIKHTNLERSNFKTIPLAELRPRPRLEIRTFKNLEIRLNAKTVHFPFAKCTELLVWLALHGSASKDQICDALWNGAATRSNLEYFRVVVRHTRRALIEAGALGFDPLIFEHKRYQLSPQLEIRVDALELANAHKSQDPTTLQAALEVYRGEFLPDTTSEWANIERTVIVDLALDIAIRLASSLEEQHDPRAAIVMFKRAVEIEPLSEIATRALIRLHKQLGEPNAAEAVLKAYQKMLRFEG
jgi:DNA-binding SARP family transcriptional activator